MSHERPSPIVVNANGGAITERMVRFTVFEMVKAMVWEKVDHVRIHPAQWMLVLETMIQIIEPLPSVARDRVQEALSTTEFKDKLYPITFIGKTLVQDDKMDKCSILFADEDGIPICQLNSLADPVEIAKMREWLQKPTAENIDGGKTPPN